MAVPEVLKDYTEFEWNDGRYTRTVYRRGQGPGVIIIHEIPGLHPLVVRFADHVAAAGMTVFLPSLFGEPGRPVTMGYVATEMAKSICVRREFRVWATDGQSPIVDWLRALSRKVHAECGGRGVGAIGMCLTGNFALAMMTEPAVVAPVLSQPSLPVGLGAARKAALGVSDEEIACAKRRFIDENLSMIGLRFHGDPLVSAERFANFKATFGDRFEAIEIDPKHARPFANQPPHSVLTLGLRDDDPDGPTKRAERRVIEFFSQRLAAL
jgi:dienelactone hydrolase